MAREWGLGFESPLATQRLLIATSSDYPGQKTLSQIRGQPVTFDNFMPLINQPVGGVGVEVMRKTGWPVLDMEYIVREDQREPFYDDVDTRPIKVMPGAPWNPSIYDGMIWFGFIQILHGFDVIFENFGAYPITRIDDITGTFGDDVPIPDEPDTQGIRLAGRVMWDSGSLSTDALNDFIADTDNLYDNVPSNSTVIYDSAHYNPVYSTAVTLGATFDGAFGDVFAGGTRARQLWFVRNP